MASRIRSARATGFTLIELLIVITVIAIITAIAVPSYNGQVRKARRAEAQSHMQQVALLQEKFRADNPGFTADWANLGGNPDTHANLSQTVGEYYNWTISGTPGAFTITATAQGGQAADKVGSTSCSPLTINQNGDKGPDPDCWSR